MGAVQVHTWYSCSFLIAASVRSLTRVKLYFILNASSLRLWHFRGSLFPRYSGLNPPLSLSGSPRILRVFSEVRLPCLSPGGSYVPSPPQYTQTCPLECPSQILPAIQDPSFHKQCLLIKETELPTPERPQAAQVCFPPPSCKFLHGLGFWKLGHIIFLSFSSVCLSLSLKQLSSFFLWV